MITTLVSILALGAFHGTPLTCPVMGGKVDHKLPGTDYNGVRYGFCCPACKAPFEKDPKKALATEKNKGKTLGAFLFDPVSGNRLEHDKAVAVYSDFGGVRYMFEKEENKATFDKDPKKYGTLPEKEALYCPVSKEVVASYADASGYVDHKGVRYYMCCPGCETKFAQKPDEYAAASTNFVKLPAVANPKAKEAAK